MLNVEGHLHLGGVPDLALMTAGMHAANFHGCLADLRLNGRRVDLMRDALDGRNVRNCEGWEPLIDSNSVAGPNRGIGSNIVRRLGQRIDKPSQPPVWRRRRRRQRGRRMPVQWS